MMERKIKLKTLNVHITCRICRGYLIDATTVTECLHTFCKSCLVKHLEEKNTCPQCETLIHQSHPLNYVAYDRTMQDVVYRLVPELQKKELRREHDYYKSKGLPFPRNLPPNLQALLEDVEPNAKDVEPQPGPSHQKDYAGRTGDDENRESNHGDCHRLDEQINLCLESENPASMSRLARKFIRVSQQATVTTLKKFLSKQIYNTTAKYNEVDILCNEKLLGKDHNLQFVWCTLWRSKEPPLQLKYRPKMEL